jgi:hypothetical protein
MVANIKQKAVRGVALLAAAFAIGEYMQSMPTKDTTTKLRIEPTKLETVAAGSEAVAQMPPPPMKQLEAPRLPQATITQAPAPVTPQPEVVTADPCAASLELSVAENAMVGITLISACRPNERVVLKHAGLALTAKTTLTGAIFTDLPALEPHAQVEVLFKDGTSISSTIEVPEVVNLRRYAIEWQGDDAFLLHGFENGANFGEAGDINGANPNRPPAGVPAKAGFLSILGDSTTEMPLLAELYTFPTDPKAAAEVVVEAPVIATTCGREMLAETLFSQNGKVARSDLTVAMPECDAIGDYLVLNNLLADMTIASIE